MGRLFWKCFALVLIAQLVAIAGVASVVWLRDQNVARERVVLDRTPPAAFVVDAAAQTLQYGGLAALRSLLSKSGPVRVYAVDQQGKELLGRPIPIDLQEKKRDQSDPFMRELILEGGAHYTLFSIRKDPDDRPPPPYSKDGPPRVDSSPIPFLPLFFAIVVSLIVAAMLAWYLAKPIGVLRAAFDALAKGRLDKRIGYEMAQRNDELAELGLHFDRMAEQLQLQVENQRRLLHDVSHEMRTPLARLQAAIGLIRQSPEKMDASLSRIERESERIDALVGELLALSRLDSGQFSALSEEFDLSELLEDLLEDARFEAQQSGHQITYQGLPHLYIKGRAELLHRALENIVRNALIHSPAGGMILFSVQTQTRDAQHYVEIQIRDQGQGVPESELNAIFEPFHRGENSRKTEGHGLGLAIARRVVNAHQGNIHAFNVKDSGLCVAICLPLVRVKAL